MTADFASINLTNHFLIAMPGLEDAGFAKSVVFICDHTKQGALGLVINKPCELSMCDLFEKIDLSLQRPDLVDAPVLLGGPVNTDRGFVLHDALVFEKSSPRYAADASQTNDLANDSNDNAGSVYASTLSIPGGLEMTTSKDVLEAIAMGAGPKRVLISLGYAAWGEGQLESELAENSWLTVDADSTIMFDTPVEERYERAMQLLGLQSWMLSREVGHS